MKNNETEFPVVSKVTLALTMSAKSTDDYLLPYCLLSHRTSVLFHAYVEILLIHKGYNDCILIHLNESVIEFSFVLLQQSYLDIIKLETGYI